MPNVVSDLLPYALLGIAALAAILFLVALWYFRRSRRDPYWVLRRNASRIGLRVFLISLALFSIATLGWISTSVAGWIMSDGPTETVTAAAMILTQTDTAVPPTETPALSPTEAEGSAATEVSAPATQTPEPSSTITLTPTDVAPTATPTQRPSNTPRPQPTTTPSATPTISPIVPRESDVVSEADAELVILNVSSAVDENLAVIAQQTPLTAGISRIYFTVEYHRLQDGVAWERALFRDDELVQSGAYLWNAGVSGEIVNFFGFAEGFPAGSYEIRLYLAGTQMTAQSFTLVEP